MMKMKRAQPRDRWCNKSYLFLYF